MKSLSKTQKILFLSLSFLLLIAGTEWVRSQFMVEEHQLRQEIRHELQRQFPALKAENDKRYGLHPCDPNQTLAKGARQVVLIHGLDDPGQVWSYLAPQLVGKGYACWLMRYPDDQPISESAQYLHQQLVGLRQQKGITHLRIVAHSMGGLVTREMLTAPGLAKEGVRPQITQLIMVGTPNHGSEMARFRILSEFGDQLGEMIDGRFEWFGWLRDGAGEAGIDLTPGSPFLQALNARPAPSSTHLAVIAGVMGEVERQTMAKWLEQRGGAKAQPLVHALGRLLASVGDGAVPLASARLEGAEFYQVEGNHLSILFNLTKSSTREPAAVPIVLELLARPDTQHHLEPEPSLAR